MAAPDRFAEMARDLGFGVHHDPASRHTWLDKPLDGVHTWRWRFEDGRCLEDPEWELLRGVRGYYRSLTHNFDAEGVPHLVIALERLGIGHRYSLLGGYVEVDACDGRWALPTIHEDPEWVLACSARAWLRRRR